MEKLLQIADPPTAVFCYNDMSALGALRTLCAQGIRVPADISLIGFDDLAIASYTSPLLTTVRQPKQQMGRIAMQMLLDTFSGVESKSSIKVEGELILRESTAPPSRFDGNAN